MGKETEIAWTDHTFNPWWGCQRVSPGCEHCYAEAFAKRTGHAVWGPGAEYRRFGAKHWNEPLKWNRDAEAAGVRRRVFCASMADVFDERGPAEDRSRLWELIMLTPHLDWLLLTKRPENLRAFLPPSWLLEPMGNVWLGTTVEDQKRADQRIPLLLEVPAVVRFLSMEPLLGPVNLGLLGTIPRDIAPGYELVHERLDWVIVGGESGGGARPFSLAWARDLRDQCRDAGVAFFCKQLGARPKNPASREEMDRAPACDCGPGRHGPGCVFSDRPLRLKDAKGGDMAEWPADLRVREFPEARP